MTQNLSDRVVVRVGEQDFFTTRATLAPSQYFTNLWSLHPPEQTEYFVDADPALFQHVLRYLRTQMFPLFYDPVKGHDKCLYFALLQQARFYKIEPLQAWIAQEKYHEAVGKKTRGLFKTLYGEGQIQRLPDFLQAALGKDETFQILSSSESVERCWHCPWKKWQHHGDKNNCLKVRCFETIYHESKVEMRVLRVSVMVSSTSLNEDVCLPFEPAAEQPPPYVPA